MKNKLSHFQLARVITEDLARFLSTGTTLTRHAQLALFIAANQHDAEKQLSEFLIGESTPIADRVAQAWSILCAGLGLIQAAAIVDGATAVLEGWQERERKRPEWLQAVIVSKEIACTGAQCQVTELHRWEGPQGGQSGSSERPQFLS